MTDGNEGWAKAHHWFTREAVPAFGVTPPQIAVYGVLRDRADEHGVTFPGQDRIARESGQSPRAVRAALKRLIEVGLVQVVSRGTKQGNRYRVGARPSLPIPAPPAAILDAPVTPIPAPPASDSGTSCLSIEAPDAYEEEPGKENQEGDVTLRGARDRADDADERWPLTDAQQRNVLDAITAVDARCDSIDVLGFGEVELAYLDGLSADKRRARIAVWSGLRSRALTKAGDDLVVDDRLHDLLFAHGYLSPEPDSAESAPLSAGEADDANADGQSRLAALLPAFTVPDEQRRQPPAPTSRARASTAHRHVFDPVSGYCGCGHRNDRLEAS